MLLLFILYVVQNKLVEVVICYRIYQLFASMVDKDCTNYAMMDDDVVDISLTAEIKEELLDDAGDFDVTDVNSHLSDVETEDDDDVDDVVVVDVEKTMQYLSGSRLILRGSI